MYSYLLQSCIHCQSAISNNGLIEKINSAIMDAPTLNSKVLPPCKTNANFVNFMPWGNLKMWCDISWFFVSWRYTKKSQKITKNHDHCCISQEKSVVPFSPPCKQPDLHLTTPPNYTNTPGWQALVALSVFMKKGILGKYLDSSNVDQTIA